MSEPAPATPDPKSTEPAMKIGTITAVTTTLLAVALEFGFKATDKQQALILTAALILVPIAQAAWTRRKVWSPAKVAALLREARRR